MLPCTLAPSCEYPLQRMGTLHDRSGQQISTLPISHQTPGTSVAIKVLRRGYDLTSLPAAWRAQVGAAELRLSRRRWQEVSRK